MTTVRRRDLHAALAAGHGTRAVHSEIRKNMARTEADRERIGAMRAATRGHPGPLSAAVARKQARPVRAPRAIISGHGLAGAYWSGPNTEEETGEY